MPSQHGLWTVTTIPRHLLEASPPGLPDGTVAVFSKPITLESLRWVIPDPLEDED